MTLLAPDPTTTDTGGDEFAHYFHKRDLDRALFDGVEVTALCGRKTRPLRGVEGRDVCPPCREALEGYPE